MCYRAIKFGSRTLKKFSRLHFNCFWAEILVTYLVFDEENDAEVRKFVSLSDLAPQKTTKNGRGWPHPFLKIWDEPNMDKNYLLGPYTPYLGLTPKPGIENKSPSDPPPLKGASIILPESLLKLALNCLNSPKFTQN